MNSPYSRLRRSLPWLLVGLGGTLGAIAAAGCGVDPALGDDAATADAAVDAEVMDAGPPDADPPDAFPLTIGLSTLAGSGEAANVDGARNVARFNDPVNLAVAPDNVVFVADFNNGSVRRVTMDGHVTTMVRQPGFARPFAIAFGPTGELYVQTDYNTQLQPTGALWKINSASGVAELLVDNVGRMRGIDVLSNGRVVMADYQAHIIKVYDPATGLVTPLAGKEGMPGFANGQGDQARFNTPYDVVVETGDVIIVSDQENHRIRRVTMNGNVTTSIGDGVAQTRDGAIGQARFVKPQGLALDNNGVLYISDPGAHLIRRVSGTQVTTVAGDGQGGFIDNTDPLMARFFGVEGIDITGDGLYLYIADGDLGDDLPYHRVRRVAF